jgi:hypothetical protein
VIVAACGRINFDPITAGSSGPTSMIGCSDGEREGYVDLAAFPTIAACSATWPGRIDMRAVPTGVPCGDDLGVCAAPADACASGWHVCATSGDVAELLALTATDCQDVAGSYIAASSHCLSAASTCTYPAPGAWPCVAGKAVPCSQAICCGTGCAGTGCPDGVWPSGTHENSIDYGCGETPGTSQDGVLCCRG